MFQNLVAESLSAKLPLFQSVLPHLSYSVIQLVQCLISVTSSVSFNRPIVAVALVFVLFLSMFPPYLPVYFPTYLYLAKHNLFSSSSVFTHLTISPHPHNKFTPDFILCLPISSFSLSFLNQTHLVSQSILHSPFNLLNFSLLLLSCSLLLPLFSVSNFQTIHPLFNRLKLLYTQALFLTGLT